MKRLLIVAAAATALSLGACKKEDKVALATDTSTEAAQAAGDKAAAAGAAAEKVGDKAKDSAH